MKLSTVLVLLMAHLCLAFEMPYRMKSVTQDDEERLRLALFEKYNRDILPEHDDKHPVNVEVGLSVISINGIDAKAQTLNIDSWVIFSWNDSRLVWDPTKYGNINTLRLSTSKLWLPDVTLYNGANHGDFEWTEGSKSIHTVVYSSGRVVWVPAATFKAFCDLNLSDYPYDTHKCSFRFGSWVYDGFHIDLATKGGIHNVKPMDLSDLRNSSEWRVVSTSAEKNVVYYECCPEPYPTLTFNMTLKRQNPTYQAAIITPIIVGIILTLVAYMTSPFRNVRLILNGFTMLIFILTLIHLQMLLPHVGLKTPYIVVICEAMMLLLSASMTWSVFVMTFARRCRRSKSPQLLDRFLNGWPTKVLFMRNGNVSMQECCKKISEMNQGNKDTEVLTLMTEEKEPLSVNSWMTFMLLLDRLSFMIVSTAIVYYATMFTYY